MGLRERFNVADLPPHVSEGGEALIFVDPQRWAGKALKLFLDPDDEEFFGDEKAARLKLSEIQTKLLEFPAQLPERVIIPLDLAMDPNAPRGKRIAGYYMRHVAGAAEPQRFSEKPYLDGLNIDVVDVLNKIILPVFRDLHHTVSRLHEHEADILIGDFNDTNVLVKDAKAYLVDADSFGFGKYPARLGKPEFTDPLTPDRGPCPDADWYAYSVLLLQSLLRVRPFGGIYASKKAMPHPERVRQRITIFHKDVALPQWALGTSSLPIDLRDYFTAVFGPVDKRGPFPACLLNMQWQKCKSCGAIHARPRCPTCFSFMMFPLVFTKRGGVSSETVFQQANCSIVASAYHNGQLRFLYLDNDGYKREDGSVLEIVASGRVIQVRKPGSVSNCRILAENTIFTVTFPGAGQKTYMCDPQTETIWIQIKEDPKESNFRGGDYEIKTNSSALYAFRNELLLRMDKSGKVTSGYRHPLSPFKKAFMFAADLPEPYPRTFHFSVGETVGLVYEESGCINPLRMFDARDVGIGEPIDGPDASIYQGSLVDCVCYDEKNFGWFLMSVRNDASIRNWCEAIDADGKIITATHAPSGGDSWIARIQGKCALGRSLLSPTDKGIVQVTLAGEEFRVAVVPDSDGLVDAKTKLLRGEDGIYAVKTNEILSLRWAGMK